MKVLAFVFFAVGASLAIAAGWLFWRQYIDDGCRVAALGCLALNVGVCLVAAWDK